MRTPFIFGSVSLLFCCIVHQALQACAAPTFEIDFAPQANSTLLASSLLYSRDDDPPAEEWEADAFDGDLENDKCTGNSIFIERRKADVSKCIKKIGPENIECLEFKAPLNVASCQLDISKNKECGTYDTTITVSAGVTKYIRIGKVEKSVKVQCFLPKQDVQGQDNGEQED